MRGRTVPMTSPLYDLQSHGCILNVGTSCLPQPEYLSVRLPVSVKNRQQEQLMGLRRCSMSKWLARKARGPECGFPLSHVKLGVVARPGVHSGIIA